MAERTVPHLKKLLPIAGPPDEGALDELGNRTLQGSRRNIAYFRLGQKSPHCAPVTGTGRKEKERFIEQYLRVVHQQFSS